MLDTMACVLLLVASLLLTWLTWLARRLWRRHHGVRRWFTAGLTGLFALTVFCLTIVSLVGQSRLNERAAPVPNLRVARTPEQIQRGHAIVELVCGPCHSRYAPFTGEFAVAGELPVPLGSFVASNLTPAGRLGHWTDGQIFRAIRNAVDGDGHWLIIMSYTSVGKLSDADIQSVIAYLRSQPAAGRPTANPPDRLNFLGMLWLGAGLLPRGQPIVTDTLTGKMDDEELHALYNYVHTVSGSQWSSLRR